MQTVTTKIGVGLDNSINGIRCGQEVARAALDYLGSDSPSLALLFTSHPDCSQVLKGVNDVLKGVPLIGATSAGEYTHQGYVQEGAGLMLIHSRKIRFHPFKHRQKRFRRERRLLGKLHGLTASGLGSHHNHRALVLFPDDESMNLDGVVDQALTETGMLYDIVGGPGLASPTPPRPPAVFYNQHVFRAGLAGVEILSQNPVGLALANGWQPISGPYRVTSADQKRIHTIDGRPAHEVYEDFVINQGLVLTKDTETHILLKHPIGVCKSNEKCKVSMLKHFDKNGALHMTSPPQTGKLIYILGTQPNAMITAAQHALYEAQQNMGAQSTSGVLFIDCMSTGLVLDSTYHHHQAAVRQSLGDIPFLGFRSHGVLARLQGQTAGHYECSVATCMLPK